MGLIGFTLARGRDTLRATLGFVLVGVSLFMLLGFFNADLPGSAVTALLALAVGVGIPGAAGGALLFQHFGRGKRLAGRKAELIRRTLEAELFRLAGEHQGKLTVVEVVRELAMTYAQAEELLREMAITGAAEIEVSEGGLLVYNFPDIGLLADKHTSRGVLDD